ALAALLARRALAVPDRVATALGVGVHAERHAARAGSDLGLAARWRRRRHAAAFAVSRATRPTRNDSGARRVMWRIASNLSAGGTTRPVSYAAIVCHGNPTCPPNSWSVISSDMRTRRSSSPSGVETGVLAMDESMGLSCLGCQAERKRLRVFP